jgi:hypothetical protein
MENCADVAVDRSSAVSVLVDNDDKYDGVDGGLFNLAESVVVVLEDDVDCDDVVDIDDIV